MSVLCAISFLFDAQLFTLGFAKPAVEYLVRVMPADPATSGRYYRHISILCQYAHP